MASSLSAFDAAVALRALTAMTLAPGASHSARVFSTMDALAQVVRAARGSGIVAPHHEALFASVLPGLGQLGQESSVLSL
jgi:hypothetical protein